MSRAEKGEWKVVVLGRGGLINHSYIVIDFLLKGVSQTVNYRPACAHVCVVLYSLRAQRHQL